MKDFIETIYYKGRRLSIDVRHFFRKYYSLFKDGISCCDMASYDDYITKKISKDLKHFAKSTDSYPMESKSLAAWKKRIVGVSERLRSIERFEEVYDKIPVPESKKARDRYYKLYNKGEFKAYKERTKAFHDLADLIGSLWL